MTRAQAITKDISENINTQKVLFRILFGSVVFLSLVYIYLIGSITFDVIARKSLENTIASMTSQVNQLDLAYLNKINEINKEYALSNGFVEVRQNLFVSRDVNHVAIR